MLIRDSLTKRRKVDDSSCLLCCEYESVQHLFFDCAVAKQLWSMLPDILKVNIGGSLDDVGKFWQSNKRHGLLNMVTFAALSIWKLRDDLCFQKVGWKGMDVLLYKMAGMVQNWIILCTAEKKVVETDYNGDQEFGKNSFVALELKKLGTRLEEFPSRINMEDLAHYSCKEGRYNNLEVPVPEAWWCNLVNSMRLM